MQFKLVFNYVVKEAPDLHIYWSKFGGKTLSLN